jgi:hypothetical protein
MNISTLDRRIGNLESKVTAIASELTAEQKKKIINLGGFRKPDGGYGLIIFDTASKPVRCNGKEFESMDALYEYLAIPDSCSNSLMIINVKYLE